MKHILSETQPDAPSCTVQQFLHSAHLLVCGFGVVDLILAVDGGERDAIGDDLVGLLFDVGRRGVALPLVELRG